MERDHFRRSMQRHLAGHASLARKVSCPRARCSVLHAAPQSRGPHSAAFSLLLALIDESGERQHPLTAIS
jgi:hypothetical protein